MAPAAFVYYNTMAYSVSELELSYSGKASKGQPIHDCSTRTTSRKRKMNVDGMFS